MRIVILAILLGSVLVGCGKEQPAQAQASTACSDDTAIQPREFSAVRDLAMKGNYQAQRNLAYGYVGGFPYPGQEVKPTLGCAWYKVILLSGSEKINEGDFGNAKVYCGSLTPDEQAVAESQTKVLIGKLCK